MEYANPQYILFAGILAVILLDFLRHSAKSNKKTFLHYLTAITLGLALVFDVLYGNMDISLFSEVSYSQFVTGFMLFISFFVYLFIIADKNDHSIALDISYLSAVLGSTLVVLSSNLISLFLSIELLSIASYALIYMYKSGNALEGAVKYLSTGIISMVILIFGISLIYAGAGTLSFSSLHVISYLPFIAGVAIVIAGLGFKSTLVPFHMWAPDTYEASKSSVTAFISSVSKAAGLIAMIRIFFFALPVSSSFITALFLSIALITIFLSAFLASVQDRIKRILAYSSISQAGFAFISIAVLTTRGINAAVFYIFAFAVADAIVFLAYDMFENRNIIYKKESGSIMQVSRIGAIAFFIGILSLAGFPPTIGFFGKLLIFYALFSSGYFALVILAFFALLVSIFYYFNILSEMLIVGKLLKTKNHAPIKKEQRIKEAILVILTLSLFVGVIFA
jgi:proton-translocating NADH-quinone oxidoreductase chain N